MAQLALELVIEHSVPNLYRDQVVVFKLIAVEEGILERHQHAEVNVVFVQLPQDLAFVLIENLFIVNVVKVIEIDLVLVGHAVVHKTVSFGKHL